MSPVERLQADARKAEILKSALGVFALKGFAATTTKDLAAAAGVSEGLLYKHFPGKESLYRELAHFTSQDSVPVSEQLAKVPPSTGSLVHGLYYLTRMVLSGPCGGEQEHDFILRLMCRSLLEDGAFATAFMEGAFLPYVEPLEVWFAAARKAGDIHPGAKADRMAIFFSHHLMVGIRLHSLRHGAKDDLGADPETVFREAVLFNLRGAGLTEAALRKHLDFDKLDHWFAGLFGLEPKSPVPTPAVKRRKK
jgi:AcrR family transcriptional regulator